MDKQMLLELAGRVEAAGGADREIDRAIMEALRRAPDYAADWGPRDNCHPAPFAYTASLDAAMGLVPEGYDWIIEHVNGGLTIGARVGHNDPDRTSWGATPALALTAACLRALAVQS